MLVKKSQFSKYQNIFLQKIKATPHTIGLETVSPQTSTSADFSIENFVGDNIRTSKTIELQALYEKEISTRTREKYGLPIEVNGIVYLSPKQLVPLFGDYHLDWNRTKIHFQGRIQVIERIIYLEEMYDSCIGLQIFVKDDSRGG